MTVKLQRYVLGVGIHKVKLIGVEARSIGGYEVIKAYGVNQSNGFIGLTIFLNDKFLLHRFVSLLYDVDDIDNEYEVGEDIQYEIDEKDFEGLVVYINLVQNESGYIVLDDIVDEEDYEEYLRNTRK